MSKHRKAKSGRTEEAKIPKDKERTVVGGVYCGYGGLDKDERSRMKERQGENSGNLGLRRLGKSGTSGFRGLR